MLHVERSVACVFFGWSHLRALQKTAGRIEMPFRKWTRGGPRNGVLGGGQDHPIESGTFSRPGIMLSTGAVLKVTRRHDVAVLTTDPIYTNQSISQTAKQPTNQPTYPSIHQTLNQSINQSMFQPVNQSIKMASGLGFAPTCTRNNRLFFVS